MHRETHPQSDDLLRTLNSVQREAVEATDGPVLILAGAGSGKTRVLTHKVAYVVRRLAVSPHHVLAFTFTNKAAEEMRERIERLLGGAISGLWVGTFHATCVRILRRYREAAGLGAGFSIFDRDDSLAVIKVAIAARHLSEEEFRPRVIIERISAAKSSMRTPAELQATAANRWEELCADIYASYEDELARQAGLDFDDLLVRTLRLFEDAPGVREELAERFRYVFVDEYQDTNRVQFLLTTLLASKHRNLTVVGDDDQSIYGWRGADIGNILDFERHFPEARVFRLEQNYRSTQRILDAANAVVARNEGRKPKRLWTENDAGEKLGLVLAPDEEREAEEICRKVLQLKRCGDAGFGDQVVLYRTNAQSRPLEEMCFRHRIAYRIVGGLHFFRRREVKDVLAYLKLAANPRDETSFDRAIGMPRRGVGDVSRARFLEHARANGLDLVEAALQAPGIAGLTRNAAEELYRFGTLLRTLQEKESVMAADEALTLVVQEGGIWNALAGEGAENVSRRENVAELVAGARHFAARGENHGFRAYLEEVSLRTDIDAWDPGEDALTLMTAHNAKGLEFDVVFVAGLEEGLFPHASSVQKRKDLEEERRLFYVALTRARRRCFLSAAIERRRMAHPGRSRPSPFLEEIPEDLIEKRDPWGLGLSSGRFSSRALTHRHGVAVRTTGRPEATEFDEPVIDLNDDRVVPGYVGRVVWHAKYGRGVVVGQDGEGESAKCEVRFPGNQTKKIVARFLDVEDDQGA